jgi:hypothetical protein
VVVTLVTLVVSIAACGDAVTSEAFVDNWQEPRHKPLYVMRIDAPRNGVFRVTYPRFYPSYGELRFKTGRLTCSPVSRRPTDVIICDAGSDSVTITSGSRGRS